MSKVRKKKCDALPQFSKFRGRYSTLINLHTYLYFNLNFTIILLKILRIARAILNLRAARARLTAQTRTDTKKNKVV